MSSDILIHLRNHLWSATGTLLLVAAVVFGRFAKDTRDRFFTLFAIGFLLLGTQYWLLALWRVSDEARHLLYLLRLVGFLFIGFAVYDKNRKGG